jgi:hypothetical protein
VSEADDMLELRGISVPPNMSNCRQFVDYLTRLASANRNPGSPDQLSQRLPEPWAGSDRDLTATARVGYSQGLNSAIEAEQAATRRIDTMTDQLPEGASKPARGDHSRHRSAIR